MILGVGEGEIPGKGRVISIYLVHWLPVEFFILTIVAASGIVVET